MSTTRKATFFRLLSDDDKGTALLSSLRDDGDERRFDVDPEAFEQVPTTPFAYWVSDRLRRLFTELPAYESEEVGRHVAVGLQTSDDFRFVRCWWEVPASAVLDGQSGPYKSKDVADFQQWCQKQTFSGRPWTPFAKGGSYSPYHADLHLVVNWENNGQIIKTYVAQKYPYLNGNPGYVVKDYGYYFRPGLTWPLRTNGLSFRLVPYGCVFGHKGPMALLAPNTSPHRLLPYLALLNSSSYYALIQALLARTELAQSFEVGLVRSVPVLDPENISVFDAGAQEAYDLRRSLTVHDETQHSFTSPSSAQAREHSLAEARKEHNRHGRGIDARIADLWKSFDERALEQYGLHEEDVPNPEYISLFEPARKSDLAAGLSSYALGTAMGRWDVRYATGERELPPPPDPFAPLPVCSPGMLQGDDGLPLDASPEGYPVDFPEDGLIVQDATRPDDPAGLLRRLRHVLHLVYGERAADIEHEAVDLLKGSDLADYFSRSTAFFDAHLKQYSMSRRKAPIYWPLSVPSGRYVVWVYYPLLTSQTLFSVLVDHVEPRLATLRQEIESLRGTVSDDRSQRDELEELVSLEEELLAFRDEIRRITELPYRPSLHDGAILCAAPLTNLFQHTKWGKDTAKEWAKLEEGEYDWAHLAHGIWPERVEEKCRTDKSLAIAHDLEDLYEGDA